MNPEEYKFQTFGKRNYYDLTTNQQKSLNKKNGTWFGPDSDEADRSVRSKHSRKSKSADQAESMDE